MVDWMPWLKHVPEWFPFAGFQRDARLAREDLEVLTWVPFNKTLERINSGNSQPCYVEFCLDANPNPTPEELDHIAWTAMSAFTGGTDTTIGTLSTFFLAISLHPEVQKLAQQEIDEVIGPDRMPSLADRDRDQLPYVSALVQECLRSAPAFPYGVSHRAMKDEILDGYFIAKGSTVIANLWGILHDESVYQSPHSFEPERFLPKTGTPTNPNIPGRNEPGIGSIPWGYGRRLCPGMAMADSSVWIYVASVLWAFDISSTDKDLTWQNAKWNDGAFL
ncbi:hypothetical protein D9758_017992 [Tetrapyrgos nigripes]|nr:hypothetical protein D9758_017992 [Tetrapyrgos nigripes]